MVVLEERGITRKPHVVKLPQATAEYFDGWKAATVSMKLSSNPGHPMTARTSSAVLCLSDIMENRIVAIDKLQLAISLCCAIIHAIILKDLKMKKVCALWVSKDLNPKQRREGCRNAKSCLLFTRTQRDSLPDQLLDTGPGFTIKLQR
jgi:hypothetical protein